MPANLGPEYLEAEQHYRQAESVFERIAALERMYAALPKHKGTEKMQAELRRRLSAERKEGQKKGAVHGRPFYLIDPEGAGQVALLGPPNSGKSSLLRRLTNATPEVAPFPFTTRAPSPGMMKHRNVAIQLLDLPPAAAEFTEPWMGEALRHADRTVLVVDVTDPADLEEIEFIESCLPKWRVPPPELLAANKCDLPGGLETFAVLEDLYGARYRCLPVSAETGEGLDRFAEEVFGLLHVVRVYTKAPGQPIEFDTPYTLPEGATVLDAARRVHKDFAEQLKYARLFHPQHPRDGRMVDKHHVLEDEDILEFHI
jgi:small GTP-binding protein